MLISSGHLVICARTYSLMVICVVNSPIYESIDTNSPLTQYMHHTAMVSREVGEELVYPSLAAALLTAVLVLLLSATVGEFLMERNAMERFLREWLPILQPFLQVLPRWAREAPFIFGSIAAAAIVTARVLAGFLPAVALFLLALAVACAIALVAPPTRLPAGPEDWIFVCYVTMAAFVGGAPRAYEDQI